MVVSSLWFHQFCILVRLWRDYCLGRLWELCLAWIRLPAHCVPAEKNISRIILREIAANTIRKWSFSGLTPLQILASNQHQRSNWSNHIKHDRQKTKCQTKCQTSKKILSIKLSVNRRRPRLRGSLGSSLAPPSKPPIAAEPSATQHGCEKGFFPNVECATVEWQNRTKPTACGFCHMKNPLFLKMTCFSFNDVEALSAWAICCSCDSSTSRRICSGHRLELCLERARCKRCKGVTL